MGLNARVGEYESPEYVNKHLGSYGGYRAWKKAIAKAKGFDLEKMEGFGGNESWKGKPFPLVLNHSDYDGEYTLEQIPDLLKELEEIQKLGIIDDYERSKKFITLCKAALKYKNPIIFE